MAFTLSLGLETLETTYRVISTYHFVKLIREAMSLYIVKTVWFTSVRLEISCVNCLVMKEVVIVEIILLDSC